MTDQSLFRNECTIIMSHEDIWETQPYGDLMAYSTFLVKHLFNDGVQGYTLVIPSEQRTSPDSFMTFEKDLLSIYLFPSNIREDDTYEFHLKEFTFNMLMTLPLIKIDYSNNWNKQYLPRHYYLVQGLDVKYYQEWAMYVFTKNGAVSIFTLPLDWEGLKG